jgi:hypothetical protein
MQRFSSGFQLPLAHLFCQLQIFFLSQLQHLMQEQLLSIVEHQSVELLCVMTIPFRET